MRYGPALSVGRRTACSMSAFRYSRRPPSASLTVGRADQEVCAERLMALHEPDIRELSAYGIVESAQQLRVPVTTVGAWVAGTTDGSGERRNRCAPCCALPPNLRRWVRVAGADGAQA